MTPPRQIAPDVFQEGVAALRGYLQRRFSPLLSPSDVDELAVDAVTRFYEASLDGLVHETGNPTGYMIKIAVSSALARLKQSRRALRVDDMAHFALNDEQTAAKLDQLATADTLERAMNAAHHAHDATAVRVATFLLDETQRTGLVPSNRTTAQALGLSHTGVAKALQRLRHFIEQAARD